jgi:hypothetical protein
MRPADPVPAELKSWVDAQVNALRAAIKEIQKITDDRTASVASWGLDLLPELIEAETRAKRAAHLLTAYLLRERIATPTAIARAADMTVTGVQGRANGTTALDAWAEVWPGKS